MPCRARGRARGGDRLVVRGEHAALAAGDVLGGVEAEGGRLAERADRAAAVLRLDRVSGVLDRPARRAGQRPPSISSMSHGWPAKCTTTIALVRGVTAAASACGSMLRVSGCTSQKTGVAPQWTMTLAVEAKVIGVVMTSSPRPTPRPAAPGAARRYSCSWRRRERQPRNAAKRASSALVRGPVVSQPERSTSSTALLFGGSERRPVEHDELVGPSSPSLGVRFIVVSVATPTPWPRQWYSISPDAVRTGTTFIHSSLRHQGSLADTSRPCAPGRRRSRRAGCQPKRSRESETASATCLAHLARAIADVTMIGLAGATGQLADAFGDVEHADGHTRCRG